MPQPAKNKRERRFRWMAVGLGLLVGLLLVFGGLKIYQNAQAPHFLGTYEADGFEPHPYLGYAPKQGTVISSCKTLGGDTLYCAQYTIDAQGLRVMPQWPEAQAHLLFFGCSYTYGEGVNDTEAFTYQIAEKLPNHQAYNYGYSGYGPQQMLAQWQWGNIPQQVTQPEGLMVYTLLSEHVHRAAGAPYYLQSWGSSSPHYALVGDSLVYYPNHMAWRWWHTNWQRFLGWSGLGGLFTKVEPYTADDVTLTVAILKKSKEYYLAAFPQGRFIVMVPPQQVDTTLLAAIKSAGIEVLDLSARYPLEAPYIIEGDGHPSPAGHRLLADSISTWMSLPPAD